jgi:hypothetical protein
MPEQAATELNGRADFIGALQQGQNWLKDQEVAMKERFSNSDIPKKALGFLLILSVIVTFGCNFITQAAGGVLQGVEGSGKIITQDRAVSGFNRVELGGTGQVTITQGDQEALTVEADDNIMPYIRSDVRGNTLYLGYTAAASGMRIRPSTPIKFNITMKQISGLEVSGSGNITAPNVDTSSLELQISGSGNVDIAALKAVSLDTGVSGSGSVNLSGQVTDQKISISGSGKYEAAKLQSQTADVSVSGSGDTTLWVTETLNVHISGSGDVSYYGNPGIQSSSSGSGKIRSLGNP